jgi:hypothetical protein
LVAACSFPDIAIVEPVDCTTDPDHPDCPAMGACMLDSDCPPPEKACQLRRCVDHTCLVEVAKGECPTSGPGVCAPSGDCVECLEGDTSRCMTDEICADGQCAPEHCDNGTADVDESDRDCGGDDCPPCANDMSCNGPGDCESGVCEGDPQVCVGCSGDGDCPGDRFCNGDQICEAERENALACSRNGQCLSTQCPADDDICCEMACDGECMSCLESKTGEPDGECHPIQAQSDPDDECEVLVVGQIRLCNGMGKCSLGGN